MSLPTAVAQATYGSAATGAARTSGRWARPVSPTHEEAESWEPERDAADGPAVHEHHVATRADATVSDLAGAHVEEAVRDPYRTLTPFLVDTWIEWATEFIEGTPEQGRVEADTAITVVDGLVFLRQVGGPDAADRATARLGIA